MAVYTYVAKDEKGGMFTGTYTDVDSASTLRSELDKMGYVLVKARRGKQDVKGRRFGRRVKQSEVAGFVAFHADICNAYFGRRIRDKVAGYGRRSCPQSQGI